MWSERKGKGQAQEGRLMNNQSCHLFSGCQKGSTYTDNCSTHNPRLTVKPDCCSLFLEIRSFVALDWVKVECFSCGVFFKTLGLQPWIGLAKITGGHAVAWNVDGPYLCSLLPLRCVDSVCLYGLCVFVQLQWVRDADHSVQIPPLFRTCTLDQCFAACK